MSTKKLFISAFSLVFSAALYLYAQTPLSDATATYSYKNQNFKLGLYEGTNDMPAEHLADGMAIAKEMRSMSKINIVIVGHSVPQTTTSNWNWSSTRTEFKLAANTNFICGAVSAKMAWDWINEFKGSYKSIGGQAQAAGDIHVLVIQLTWAPFMGPDSYEMNTALQSKIDSMGHDLARMCQNAKKNLPNLKMILLQADPWQNNHEPYHAYHEWFFARKVVMDQINGNGAVDLSYKGASPKTVWVDLGGYWWKANDNSSYYSDCCHVKEPGCTEFKKRWVTALLANPVHNQWLAATPDPNYVENTLAPVSPELAFNFLNFDQGIKVAFTLLSPSQVGLGLFSANGQAIVPMFEKTYTAGKNSVLLQADNPLTPGSYIVRFDNGTTTKSQVMTVAK